MIVLSPEHCAAILDCDPGDLYREALELLAEGCGRTEAES